jgi:alkylation response protein AidB-like acyl-CoA dehydrogenase
MKELSVDPDGAAQRRGTREGALELLRFFRKSIEGLGVVLVSDRTGGRDETSAVRDGDDWILNGSKTFISAGINSDLVVVVARTDPEAGHKGFSLLVVERGMEDSAHKAGELRRKILRSHAFSRAQGREVVAQIGIAQLHHPFRAGHTPQLVSAHIGQPHVGGQCVKN